MEPSTTLRILHLEDDPNDAALVQSTLKDGGFACATTRVQTQEAFVAALEDGAVDLILSDFTLPEFDGLSALEIARTKCPHVPLIFVSGTLGEERSIVALTSGATDYVLKEGLGRLVPAVRRVMVEVEALSARRQLEQESRENEAKFRTLFDMAKDTILLLQDGLFVDCNPSALALFGVTREQLIGQSPIHFSPATQPDGRDSQEKAEEITRETMVGEPQVFEWLHQRPDDTKFYVDVSLSRIELRGEPYLQAIARDITDRKQADEQIAEQAALLDEAQDAILVRDLKGKILFWNKGAERMYGWSRKEVIGRAIGEFLTTDPKTFAEVTALTIKNGKWTGECQHQTKDRREITIEARWTLIRDQAGNPKSILAINTDITEKKKIEAQFMRAQRMESIGTLAGGIAHDLNNILAPIMMSIDILKTTTKHPQAKEILETIEVSARRGADIVRQVLSFARGLEGQRIEIQPKHLLKELESIIKDTFPKGIRLHFAIPNDTWTILGDPTQVHQILLNLCVNARDAMPNGGNLTIQVENCAFDEQYAGMNIQAKPGRYVNISVTDSGSGIPPDVLDKIFEPFFTTKEIHKGSGLGLSTVMAVVKSHDGIINVYSDLGKGTTFKVYLPAAELTSEAQKKRTQLISLPRGKGEMILMVDDETSILTVTSQTLRAFGYRVLTATNGAEGVALYAENKHEIAVVLTDMMMPVMDGPATIYALMKINPEIKIIATSGLNANGSGNRAPGTGVKHLLTKPYTAEALLKTLRAILDVA
jgi:PAS domain S-box-containing protein